MGWLTVFLSSGFLQTGATVELFSPRNQACRSRKPRHTIHPLPGFSGTPAYSFAAMHPLRLLAPQAHKAVCCGIRTDHKAANGFELSQILVFFQGADGDDQHHFSRPSRAYNNHAKLAQHRSSSLTVRPANAVRSFIKLDRSSSLTGLDGTGLDPRSDPTDVRRNVFQRISQST
jgi:hypothetical protein